MASSHVAGDSRAGTATQPRRSTWSGVQAGVGLVEFIDETVFHQLLHWHHFYDKFTVAVGLVLDGLFHVGGFIAMVCRAARGEYCCGCCTASPSRSWPSRPPLWYSISAEGSIILHNQPGRLPHEEPDPLRLCFRSLGSSQSPKGRLEHRYMRKRRETMMANESGPNAGVEGVAEDVKGRAKEAFGAVTGNESVKKEGGAQQDKAAAERDVAAKEAEAEKARAEASAAEAEQRSHQ